MLLADGPSDERPVIGVMALESGFPKPAGHIRNPDSFDFPILYNLVRGATIQRLIAERDPALLQPFIEAARQLEGEGVKAITRQLWLPRLASAGACRGGRRAGIHVQPVADPPGVPHAAPRSEGGGGGGQQRGPDRRSSDGGRHRPRSLW